MKVKWLERNAWKYLLAGMAGRLARRPRCPSCGSVRHDIIDTKFFHKLERCGQCHILFRFPSDEREDMRHFYQKQYSQPGLTELPSQVELQSLLDSQFKNTSKDFSYIIELFSCLGIQPGERVLDYGASWGYGTWQLRKAGFLAEGFEISVPRASYAKNLGVKIATDERAIKGHFAGVYSGHVLEHVDNPLRVLNRQIELTREGGFVIGQTPNGSADRRQADFSSFHRNWGQVHPFLLTEEFLVRNFGGHALFISSRESIDEVNRWNKQSLSIADISGANLLFILRKQ